MVSVSDVIIVELHQPPEISIESHSLIKGENVKMLPVNTFYWCEYLCFVFFKIWVFHFKRINGQIWIIKSPIKSPHYLTTLWITMKYEEDSQEICKCNSPSLIPPHPLPSYAPWGGCIIKAYCTILVKHTRRTRVHTPHGHRTYQYVFLFFFFFPSLDLELSCSKRRKLISLSEQDAWRWAVWQKQTSKSPLKDERRFWKVGRAGIRL